MKKPEPILIELRDKLWIISSLDQAKTDEKVWNRIAETLCRIVYKIEMKDKLKNRIIEANMKGLCNSANYGSYQQIAYCEPYKNNFGNNMDDYYRSDSTLTSNNNIFAKSNYNLGINNFGSNQTNSMGLFSVTTTMNNSSTINNLNSFPTSINSLTNDFSKSLKISQVQYNLVNSSATIAPTDMNDCDSIKNSMSMESEISLSVMKTEDGLPMLLALQFEYIFSK